MLRCYSTRLARGPVRATAEADGPVGAGPQLPVSRAVAVRPHESRAAVEGGIEPGPEPAGLLGTAHVRAVEPPAEPTVVSHLELGGEHRVEAQAVGDRTQAHRERCRPDH